MCLDMSTAFSIFPGHFLYKEMYAFFREGRYGLDVYVVGVDLVRGNQAALAGLEVLDLDEALAEQKEAVYVAGWGHKIGYALA